MLVVQGQVVYHFKAVSVAIVSVLRYRKSYLSVKKQRSGYFFGFQTNIERKMIHRDMSLNPAIVLKSFDLNFFERVIC